MIRSYFKVVSERTGALETFLFDAESLSDTSRAHTAARAAAERHPAHRLSLWSRPVFRGPWDAVCLIGDFSEKVRAKEDAA